MYQERNSKFSREGRNQKHNRSISAVTISYSDRTLLPLQKFVDKRIMYAYLALVAT